MDYREIPSAIEPSAWYVVFHERTQSRIVSFLSFGRFKHVSAFGYYAGFKGWLVVDPHFTRLRLSMIPHEKHGLLIKYMDGCTVVKIEPKNGFNLAARPGVPGIFCVPAIKYLIGLSCVAVRPDALYRHIINNGGIPIDGQRITYPLTPGAAARSLPAN